MQVITDLLNMEQMKETVENAKQKQRYMYLWHRAFSSLQKTNKTNDFDDMRIYTR